MIRKRKRTAKQKQALAYKKAATIRIPYTNEEEKLDKALAERTVIKSVRALIWATRHTCQLCSGTRFRECAGFPDEMHEDPPRSKTRGLPPEERFNLRVCGRLCKACHRDVTENKIRIDFADERKRFLGPVSVHKVHTASGKKVC